MKNAAVALTLGALIGLSGVVVSGCSTIEEKPITSNLVVSQITMRIIQEADNPNERAERIQEIVGTLRNRINEDEVARLDEIEAVVREQIDFDELSPADADLVRFTLLKARESLDQLIGDGVFKEGDLRTLGTLFNWIESAAERAQQ